MAPLLDGANLLDSLEQAAVLTDLAATIVYWNCGAERLYGWARAEVLGRPVFEVTPTMASRGQGEEIFDAVRLGRRWSGDYRVQRKDRSTFLAFVTLAPVCGGDGTHQGVLGLSEDVTDARAREGLADDSAERLRLAVDAGHLGSWEWDRVTGAVRWDESMERIFGLPAGGFAGTVDAWLELIHPSDREAMLTVFDDVVVGTGAHPAFEYRIVHPDGIVQRVEGHGRVRRGDDGKVLGTFGYVHRVGVPGR